MDISLDSLLAIIASILCLSLLILYYKRQLHKTVNLPPGKTGWPLIGEMADFALSCAKGELDKFMIDRISRYNSPEVFKTSILGEKMAVFCSPTGYKFAFSNENKLVKSWFPHSVSKILTADYADAETFKLKVRSIAFDFVKPDAIQKYIETMDSIISQHMDQILLTMSTMNKNPKYYPNPDKFDPSRFEGNGPPPFTFTPFGGGPRMCPGHEFARRLAIVFMHNMLLKFTWEKLNPKEKIIYTGGLAGPQHGLPIKLQRRRHESEIDAS